MALIAVRMNKSYLAANEAYATLDRLFYSLIDLFADYKTGKEIRLYKEQHLIGKIATEKILTDGEKNAEANFHAHRKNQLHRCGDGCLCCVWRVCFYRGQGQFGAV